MTGAEGRDWAESEPMPFAEDDVLLPWLGSDEPLEEHRAPGPRRILLFILAGVLLAAVAGGIYWLAGRDGGPPVAEAPERPRSEDAGNEHRTATPAASGMPSPAAVKPAMGAPVAARQDAARANSEPRQVVVAQEPEGFVVQVGAYGSRRRAELGWETLAGSHQVLQGVPHRVVQAVVDGKTVHRLQAVVQSSSAASELCAALQANGADCLIRY
jgi:cell division protein FtsN